ncbi:hypothetical protein A1O3_06305 [Capronia epimyces CBS 606.96]|uniref:Uncharacterized protein n=1 Tax=Capronia epimyces CBS 606.96 TaxID=1182542 RepID=W9XPN1_9EURO|nr:uncharacterized protein A1O3_06305 [Capronia epimyces CBS 606.96]EXJ82492.1 hypothetical protein A1O3_06305 [Capronia epimyces CBS 606.96]
MSPTNTSITFSGDTFANNLFSDLGFILGLFGELPTKQFFSLSLGWYDSVILAAGPIGILTIIVSAIRVSGSRALKTIIGRARESRATAEAEILSSTSTEVCEAPIKEFIYREPMHEYLEKEELFGVGMTVDMVMAGSTNDYCAVYLGGTTKLIDPSPPAFDPLISFGQAAPNLTLCFDQAIVSLGERRMCAAAALLLQVALFISWAVVNYHWHLGRAGQPAPGYGYPCAIAGASSLFAGVLLCGYVIEDVTTEARFEPRKCPEHYQVFRLQRGCTVGSQKFNSYMIHSRSNNPNVFMSRWINEEENPNSSKHPLLTWCGVIFSLAGFLVQFIGLRTLHWSATVSQLIITVLMTAMRAALRRGLLLTPACDKLDPDHELAEVTFKLRNAVGWGLATSAPMAGLALQTVSTEPSYPTETSCQISPRYIYRNRVMDNGLFKQQSQSLLQLRNKLGEITDWEDECSAWGDKVSQSIEAVFHRFKDMSTGKRPLLKFKEKDLSRDWTLTTYLATSPNKIGMSSVHMDRIKNPCSSALSLWYYHLSGIATRFHGKPYARVVGLKFRNRQKACEDLSCDVRMWLSVPLYQVQWEYYPVRGDRRFSPPLSFGGQFCLWDSASHGCVVPSSQPSETSPRLADSKNRDRPPLRADPDPVWSLAVDGGESLLENCALELFSMYIFEVASRIARVTSPTSLTPTGRDRKARARRLTNDVIEELARTVKKSGLVKTKEDARTLLVPSFLYWKLFPPPEGQQVDVASGDDSDDGDGDGDGDEFM